MNTAVTLTPREKAILEAVTRAAENGEACPSNAILACITDCESISAPVRNLQMLEKKGLIKVVRFQRARQVTILASGRKTKEPDLKQPHWRSRSKRTRVTLMDDLAERVAGGMTVPAAARAMGISNAYGYTLWSDIKHGLGAQAA